MEDIKVVKNFITDEECEIVKQYIVESTKSFDSSMDRYIQKFGDDKYFKRRHGEWSDLVNIEGTIRDILKRIRDYTVSISGDEDVEVCQMWLSKHWPGSSLQYHNDHDGGVNTHLKYSAVIYLNTISTGRLEFPFRRLSHKPSAGDLVIFDSQHKSNGHKVDRIDDERYSMPIWLASKEHSIWNYFGVEPS
jgi:hypothetical protein